MGKWLSSLKYLRDVGEVLLHLTGSSRVDGALGAAVLEMVLLTTGQWGAFGRCHQSHEDKPRETSEGFLSPGGGVGCVCA